MKVLVDTPIWSLALRRRDGALNAHERALVQAWADLIPDNRAVLVGPVRQEVLSGIGDERVFEKLRARLSGFDDEPLQVGDYETAAQCHNRCRAAGIAGSSVDYLLCAVALRRNVPLFTTDADFTRYAQHLPVRLYALPKRP